MAIVDNNELTTHLRGRVGKLLVFRNVRGRTIASHAPRKPDPQKQSAAQRQTRVTFREAAAWAARTMLNPHEKQRHQDLARQRGLPNAYTAAVQQYMQRCSTQIAKQVQPRPEPTQYSNVEAVRFPNGGEGISSYFAGAKPIPSYAELLDWWFKSVCGAAEVQKVTASLSHRGFAGNDGFHRQRMRITGQISRSMPQVDERLVRSVNGIGSHFCDVPYDRKPNCKNATLIGSDFNPVNTSTDAFRRTS